MGRRLLRIAAVLIFLLAAVWGWQVLNPGALSTQVEYAGQVDKRMIELPDGSQVWLRKDASLEYPTAFKGRDRSVKLDGEAYFEVAHNPEKPFRVELATGGYVQVLGTAFNVCARQLDDETSVLVRNGKVQFSPDGKSQGTTLIKNQKAVFSRQHTKVNVTQVATLNELSWQTGGLEFVSTPLTKVVSDLQRYYNVRIELRDRAMGECTYTAPLTNQPIEKVLKSISLAYQMRLKTPAPGQYVLEGGNCR